MFPLLSIAQHMYEHINTIVTIRMMDIAHGELNAGGTEAAAWWGGDSGSSQ